MLEIQTQDTIFAWQTLYQLSHLPRPNHYAFLKYTEEGFPMSPGRISLAYISHTILTRFLGKWRCGLPEYSGREQNR